MKRLEFLGANPDLTFRMTRRVVLRAISQGRRHALACLVGVAWCVPTSATRAQQAEPGRIDGVVTDSVHAGALSGALVLLARRTTDTTISRSTTTDIRGRFDFDDLPSGEYVVSLESAFLDSLELSVPPRAMTLTRGEQEHVLLATPSGSTLRALACPGIQLPAGSGAVVGRVSDASNEKTLRGVALDITWNETTVDRATLRATNETRGVEVQTDSLGRFRVCGVPTDTYLELRASLKPYREIVLQLAIPEDVGLARQNVSLSVGERRTAAVTGPAANGQPARAERERGAALDGTVNSATGPLARVEVRLLGESSSAMTDSLGQYHIAAAPIGTQVLEVKRVGYFPRRLTIELRPGQNSAPELHLTSVATLDSIRVVAKRPRYREFESRVKAASFGHFLRAEDIAKKNPLLTSDLVRQMPGFTVTRVSTSDLDVKVTSSRPSTSLHPKPCDANVVIDGVPNQMINWIDPFSIGAMEIYPGVKTGPVQYQSPCGTIIIWTKRY